MLSLLLISNQAFSVDATSKSPQSSSQAPGISLVSFRSGSNFGASHFNTSTNSTYGSTSRSPSGENLPTATSTPISTSSPSSSTSYSSGITASPSNQSPNSAPDSTSSSPSEGNLPTATSTPISTSSPSSSEITVSPSASSAGLHVYSDSACSSPMGNINWGSITPGGTANTTVYIKNTGDSNSLTPSIQASNWNRTSACQYLTLSWNKQNTVLAPGQSTKATITLSVSSNVTGISTFSVQIFISGTQ